MSVRSFLVSHRFTYQQIGSYLHPLYHTSLPPQYKNPPTKYSQGDSFINLIKFFYCVSGALLLSDSSLVGCRPRDVHRLLLLLFSLVTFHKNIFSTFKTVLCVLQCASKATICGRRLVLLPGDCDLRLHRNPVMEI